MEGFSGPCGIVYAKCSPENTYEYSFINYLHGECGCPEVANQPALMCGHMNVGKFTWKSYGSSISGYTFLSGMEWSPEINEYNAVYSLDEEVLVSEEAMEDISDEDYEKWSNILYGE